jgi:uncharacterized membrane protein YkvA (DUF1232 family)
MTNSNGYSSEYSESTFWDKLRRHARPAGMRVVEHALQLFYAARHPDTPAWARAVIYGALGYFILPTDAVPDLIPGVGFSDDLGVLVMALTTIAMRITPEIREQARHRLHQWFG